jgi:hypothetical protein
MKQSNKSKVKTIWAVACLVVLVALVITGLLLDRPQPAQAFSSYLTQAENLYPGIVNSRIDNCDLCHVTGSFGRNPYGADFAANGHSFTAIEGLDSDNDGYTNIEEINALTFPGDPADPPSATATPTATSTATATTSPPTATHTATETTLPPTATQTATGLLPSATDTPTSTGLPPTFTETPTSTGVPPTFTYTPTGQPATATATITSTPVRTTKPPTATPKPTKPPKAQNKYHLPVFLFFK